MSWRKDEMMAVEAREAPGWDLRVAERLRETEPPSDDELAALRSLGTRGAAA